MNTHVKYEALPIFTTVFLSKITDATSTDRFFLEIGASCHYQARSVPVIRLQKEHEMIVVDSNDFMLDYKTFLEPLIIFFTFKSQSDTCFWLVALLV